MDPNGARYQLLLGAADWLGPDTAMTPKGSLEYSDQSGLHLREELYRFPPPEGETGPRLTDRRGAAADAFGNIYWVDPAETSVLVQSSGDGRTSMFLAPEQGRPEPDADADFAACGVPAPAQPAILRGLTVTEDHYLVVGTLEPAGLLVVDLYAAASRRHELWPADVPFVPYDLCARTGGGIFVLDADNHRLWELDERLVVVRHGAADVPPVLPDFHTAYPTAGPGSDGDPDEGSELRVPITADDAIPLDGDPIAIEAAPGGQVLLLRSPQLVHPVEPPLPSSIQILAPSSETGPVLDLLDIEDAHGSGTVPVSAPVVAYDLARLPTASLDSVYVADAVGNQAYRVELGEHEGTWTANVTFDYLAMRLFGGKGLIGGPDSVWYDVLSSWVRLVVQKRPRFTVRGTYFSRVLDGRLPGTVWHRLMVDADVPPECLVEIKSRSADTEHELLARPWLDEPALTYRRATGTELAYETNDPTGSLPTWEILLQHGEGQLLQLCLVLSGDRRTTPRLHALRVYYPRFSYVEQYLPAVYQRDAESASFLTRYLANVEGILSGIEARIAAAQALFDSRTAPADTLDWLLGWFDLAADPVWTEYRQRLFLRNVMRFLGLRGTAQGIQIALRIALDPCVDDSIFTTPAAGPAAYRVVERFLEREALPPDAGVGVAEGPQAGLTQQRWTPAQGRDDLLRRWQDGPGRGGASLDLTGGSAVDAFLSAALGLDRLDPVAPADWSDFLAGRYGRIELLNAAYGLAGGALQVDFASVAMPVSLPADGPALRDWYHYVAVLAPSRRLAHRFTVKLPVQSRTDLSADAAARTAIAQRVVALQKPAHTTFDVSFFWVAFQVGLARLGEDTLLRYGGRDPQFHQSIVLGQQYAGESHLGGPPPPSGGHVGRDTLSTFGSAGSLSTTGQ